MLGKLKQIIMLLRIMATPQITRPPLSVLQELRKRGKKRLPSAVWQEIDDNRKLKTSTFAFARELLSSECISRHDGKYVVNSFLPPFRHIIGIYRKK